MKVLLFSLLITSIFLACAPAVVEKPVIPPTNTEAIIKAIEKIEIPWTLIRAGERIALINIETEKSRDYPINYLIEDRLIKKISEKGAIPVERNTKLLPGLLLESGSSIPGTNLATASKIVTYRVLDCGIEFVPSAGGALIRRASAILHIRLEDAKKGNILWLGRVEGKYEDQIPPSMIGKLEPLPLIFYDNAMPNVK
ncbi:MAG: hypothetical protein ABIL70_08175 [candidate division WOR-3 bacterium]